jgi:uncharacterized protein YggE
MTDSEQYIEVIAQARLSRAIEFYRADITLNVATRKKDACLEHALALRTDVLAALNDAGLSDTDIQDGSGSFEQSNWSSSKYNSQVIRVQHADMKILVNAMARVESVFVARKQGFWSPIKYSFTFDAPQPVYKFDANSADNSLSTAIQDAKTQAAAIAAESGSTIIGITSVVQLSRAPLSPTQSSPNLTMVSHFSDDLCDFDDSYNPSTPRKDTGTNTYRVRFSVQPGA